MGELEKYVRMSLEIGAENVKTVSVQDLIFDPRTILKCMYGCDDGGKAGRVHLLQRHLCHGKLKKSCGCTDAVYLCTPVTPSGCKR